MVTDRMVLLATLELPANERASTTDEHVNQSLTGPMDTRGKQANTMRIPHTPLRQLVTSTFSAAGCSEDEAKTIAHHLVDANLAGHDSHGVIRVSFYINWLKVGKVRANQTMDIVFENDVVAVADANLGFGQQIGVHAMELALKKSEKFGLAAVALRNSAHLGRIGHWAEIAARAGRISLHFVNTSGLGMLVAPVGGIDRRLSANPVAAGIPLPGETNLIWDISTSMVAEGKLKVAFNKGVPVPEGAIINAAGEPTTDAGEFYTEPRGAILPFGGHKGYGLGLVAEILAGALTGSGCSKTGIDQLEQGMLTIVMNPETFVGASSFVDEAQRFLEFVRSSRLKDPETPILVPGEIEARNRADRIENGIDLDDNTWTQLTEAAQSTGVAHEVIEACRP